MITIMSLSAQIRPGADLKLQVTRSADVLGRGGRIVTVTLRQETAAV